MTSTHYDSLTGYLQIRCGTFTLTMCESVDKCCLHSFYYIFLIYFHSNYQHPLPWSESELTIPGTKAPGNIRSREQKFSRTFVPRSESSGELLFLGVKVPTGNFRSEERKYRGVKSPDTVQTTAQLFQSESRLTLEQATYACGRGRHCEFFQELAGSRIGWTRNGAFKVNELLSPSTTNININMQLWA